MIQDLINYLSLRYVEFEKYIGEPTCIIRTPGIVEALEYCSTSLYKPESGNFPSLHAGGLAKYNSPLSTPSPT